jgi:hypothetical protein
MAVARNMLVSLCAVVVAMTLGACSSDADDPSTVGSAPGSGSPALSVDEWEAQAADLWGDIVLIQGDADVLVAQGASGDKAGVEADCKSRKDMLAEAKAKLLPVPAGTSASDATVQALPGQIDRIEKVLDACLNGRFIDAPALTRDDITKLEAITLDLERVRQAG